MDYTSVLMSAVNASSLVIVQSDNKTQASLVEFDLLKNCKHFIFGISTYAWWAAYLSPNLHKKVITPFPACNDIMFSAAPKEEIGEWKLPECYFFPDKWIRLKLKDMPDNFTCANCQSLFTGS